MNVLVCLLAVIAVQGCVALFTLALAERLIPILPSSLMLAGLGAGAATGIWSLPSVLIISTVGGFLGALLLYGLGFLIGEVRLMRMLNYFLVPAALASRLKGELVSNPGAFNFGMQLIPTARLVAPALSGMLQFRLATFALASAPGIFLWNTTFITMGYAATSGIAGEADFMLLGAALLTILGLTQLLIVRMLRRPPPPKPAALPSI